MHSSHRRRLPCRFAATVAVTLAALSLAFGASQRETPASLDFYALKLPGMCKGRAMSWGRASIRDEERHGFRARNNERCEISIEVPPDTTLSLRVARAGAEGSSVTEATRQRGG
jgi:hypothetical protein